MQLSFRQGIIRYQTTLQGPQWLLKTSMSGTSVDLNANGEPTVMTFAHYGANYVMEENHTVVGAWGSGAVGSTNGPLAPNVTQYLYWDVDLATGALTRGWTLLAPITNGTAPVNPVNDQHWFDSVNTRMRVWRQNGSAPGMWQDKIRLFAGTYLSNAILVPSPLGSQVGITGTFTGGNLILGINNVPLKQSDGTFATTASSLIIQQTSGQNVQFDMVLTYGQSIEDIPAFYLVAYQPNKTIKLASSNSVTSFVHGVVIEDLYQNEPGQIISNGVVRNDQWSWPTSSIGAPLFCGPSGQLQLTPPPVGFVQQVGTVYDIDSIYMNLFPPVRLSI